MRAESTKCLPSAFLGVLNFHATAVLAHALVLDLAGNQREQRVIAADADAFSRRDLRPALAHAHALLRLVADAFEAWAAAVRDHLGVDVEAVHRRITYLDLGAVVEQQHAAELHRGTRLRGEPVDQDAVAGGHAVLLAAADDDGRQRTIRLGHGE